MPKAVKITEFKKIVAFGQDSTLMVTGTLDHNLAQGVTYLESQIGVQFPDGYKNYIIKFGEKILLESMHLCEY